MTDLAPLDQAVLPAGIRSRFVDDVNGLRIHILEAGFEAPGRPCILLLHGFPELAWSWRRVMGPLAAAGFHVVAPDLRGYGRTTGWDADYDSEAGLRSFRLLNAVRDALGLVAALGNRSVAAVVGARFRLPGRRLVRAGAPRRVPLGGADERAVRRPARPAVRYRGPEAARGGVRAGHPRCPGEARPAAQALPVVLLDATGQCRHVALPAGRARVPARLLSPQERRLAGRTGRSGWRAGPPRNWRRCRPTT